MYEGVADWVAFLWELLDYIWGYLFDLESGGIVYSKVNGQWILAHMQPPEFTEAGENIVSSMMTQIHTGLVFLAEISTLLPGEGL